MAHTDMSRRHRWAFGWSMSWRNFVQIERGYRFCEKEGQETSKGCKGCLLEVHLKSAPGFYIRDTV